MYACCIKKLARLFLFITDRDDRLHDLKLCTDHSTAVRVFLTMKVRRDYWSVTRLMVGAVVNSLNLLLFHGDPRRLPGGSASTSLFWGAFFSSLRSVALRL